jgi:hypothetical protein
MESSSRQSPQARLRTSSRKPALRLSFMVVALVLRNVWVWLHAEVMAQPQPGARQLRPPSLRFARLRMRAQGTSKRFHRYAQRAGLNKPVYPHMLRHTMATTLLANGCPIGHIRTLLGHEHLTTTCKYYLGGMSDAEAKDAHACRMRTGNIKENVTSRTFLWHKSLAEKCLYTERSDRQLLIFFARNM